MAQSLEKVQNLAEIEASHWSRAQNPGFLLVERTLRKYSKGVPLRSWTSANRWILRRIGSPLEILVRKLISIGIQMTLDEPIQSHPNSNPVPIQWIGFMGPCLYSTACVLKKSVHPSPSAEGNGWTDFKLRMIWMIHWYSIGIPLEATSQSTHHPLQRMMGGLTSSLNWYELSIGIQLALHWKPKVSPPITLCRGCWADWLHA